jgi:Flp pilus assembly protein TadG
MAAIIEARSVSEDHGTEYSSTEYSVLGTARRGSRRRRRGSATLEFALLLPILLSVALLCVDYGRFAFCYIAVTNAARAGAAYASRNLYTPSTQVQWQANVIQAVKDEFATNAWYERDSSKLTVDTPQLIQEGGGYWRVIVTAHYSFTTVVRWTAWTNWHNAGNPMDLKRTVVMRGTL